MIGNNPSYIIDRQSLDFRTSWELIEELTSRYVSEQKSNPNANLEIEIKTGYIVQGRDAHTESFQRILHTLSSRDLLLIGLRSQKANLQSYFGVRDIIGENYHFAKEKVSKKRFLDVKNFFEKESIVVPGKIKESRAEFSVDFGMGDGSRVTYDLTKKEDNWKRIIKNDRSNIDILHKSYPYRISYAFEERLDFNEEEFLKTNVKNIRIKDRRSYTLEYMEYSLTEVVQINQLGSNLEDFRKEFMAAKKKVDVVLEKYAEAQLRMEEEFEMEVEVIDKDIFARTLGRPEFGSFIKRLIRNAEGIFSIPNAYHKTLSTEFCNASTVYMPRIGQYFSEIYLEKIKSKEDK